MPARACKFERTSCLRKTKRNIIGNVRNNVAIPPNGHRIGAPGKSIWNSHGAMRTPLVRYKDFSRGEGPRELTQGRTPGPPERTTCVDPAKDFSFPWLRHIVITLVPRSLDRSEKELPRCRPNGSASCRERGCQSGMISV